MAAIVGPWGPSTATQFAIDDPGEPVVVGNYTQYGMTGLKGGLATDAKLLNDVDLVSRSQTTNLVIIYRTLLLLPVLTLQAIMPCNN